MNGFDYTCSSCKGNCSYAAYGDECDCGASLVCVDNAPSYWLPLRTGFLSKPYKVPPRLLCRSCGIFLAETPEPKGTLCERCRAPWFDSPLIAESRSDGCSWASVCCERFCDPCGFWSPLCVSELPADFSSPDYRHPCPNCNEYTSSVTAQQLSSLFYYAHAVCDLAGPSPEGRSSLRRLLIASLNPMKSIGNTHSIVRYEGRKQHIEFEDHRVRSNPPGPPPIRRQQIKVQDLRLSVALGVPLCAACRKPLSLSSEGLCQLCSHHIPMRKGEFLKDRIQGNRVLPLESIPVLAFVEEVVTTNTAYRDMTAPKWEWLLFSSAPSVMRLRCELESYSRLGRWGSMLGNTRRFFHSFGKKKKI